MKSPSRTKYRGTMKALPGTRGRFQPSAAVMLLCAALAVVLTYSQGKAQSTSLPAQVIPPRPLAPLSSVELPEVRGVNEFVRDQTAAIALGKALFWDMQTGSDGVTACATCHFNAGADSRGVNAISPGLKAGDTTFQIGLKLGGGTYPNHKLQAGSAKAGFGGYHDGDYPFRKMADVDDNRSVISDTNDVAASAGVFSSQFDLIKLGKSTDKVTVTSDSVFSFPNPADPSKKINTRRVVARNTPSNVNAVYNYRLFWDGRAQNVCNGANPFGERDTTSHFFSATSVAAVPVQVFVRIPNAALCSQALGPPLSSFEMSAEGRNFKELGKKLLSINPLGNPGVTPMGRQLVDPTDSYLGVHSRHPGRGLNSGYEQMIKAAFWPEWWQSKMRMCMADGRPEIIINPPKVPRCPAGYAEYSQMEYNFSLFWGIAIQEYETILRADRTPLDDYLAEEKKVTLTGNGVKALFSIPVSSAVNPNTVTVQTLDPNADASDEVIGFDNGSGRISGAGIVVGSVNYNNGAVTVFFEVPPPSGIRIVVSYHAGSSALTAQQIRGLKIFQTKGRCIACHGGPELTNASAVNVAREPLERMVMGDGAIRVYDEGFYNIGVRPSTEDAGLADVDGVAGKPLSMALMAKQKACKDPRSAPMVPGRLGEFIPAAPLSCRDQIARTGANKTPGLRNVALTAPYFHNGGQLTLEQVVEFYNRGGDFPDANIRDLDPNIQPLGLTVQEKTDLVAFLRGALTDPRVVSQSAPFDHPELFIPNGHKTDVNGYPVEDPAHPGQAVDEFLVLPATGKGGGTPMNTFLDNLARQ